MPRANTRSLLSDVDMEDTGGLLARQRNAGQQAPSSLPAVEVTPYYEIVGQTEQDAGTPQLMGQVISTPLGGTTYRSDVMDLNGNLLRSNVHDAGADKYGLGDMAKLAAVALGANTLPGLMGAEGSLTAGVTPQSVAAAEAALPTALSSAPLSTALATPLAELGTVGGLSTEAISTLPSMAAPTTAASTLASSPIGSLTDGITAESVASAEAALPKPLGPLNSFKTWATANPQLGKLLFSGAGALLSATGGGGGSGGGGYVDSGYRPTINRGGFNAAPQARQMAPTMGLLNTPTTGQPMSGLWRYGLLGG